MPPLIIEEGRLAEKALTGVIQRAHVEGISARSVVDRIKTLLAAAAFKSEVSRLSKELKRLHRGPHPSDLKRRHLRQDTRSAVSSPPSSPAPLPGRPERPPNSVAAGWRTSSGPSSRTRSAERVRGPPARLIQLPKGPSRQAPQHHSARMPSSEIKRRSEVVGIFRNHEAIFRLIGAILLKQILSLRSRQWQHGRSGPGGDRRTRRRIYTTSGDMIPARTAMENSRLLRVPSEVDTGQWCPLPRKSYATGRMVGSDDFRT